MISIVTAQREILLNPVGTNVWSGQVTQSLNSEAVTWSLAKELYGFNGPYWIIPISLIIGIVPTFFQWIIAKVGCILIWIVTMLNAAVLALAKDRTRSGGHSHSSYHIYGTFVPLLEHSGIVLTCVSSIPHGCMLV